MMQKINPWTGKQKPKSDGKFFSILAEHYPHLDNFNNLKRDYKKLSTLIQAPRPQPSLQQYLQLIDIQKKLSKIQQLQKWLDLYSQSLNPSSFSQQESSKNIPIDSSYVYLPLYSGNIFYQILKQSNSNNLHYDGLIPQRNIKKIQREIQQMEEILKINQVLMKNVII